MKNVAVIVGYLMLGWAWLSGLAFWTGIWGGIGFFGSLLTTPISQCIAILFMMFTSVEGFIGWAMFLFVAFTLLVWGSDN